MNRRKFLGSLGLGAFAVAGYRVWPNEGIWNPCLGALPEALARHEIVQEAFIGLDANKIWDCHVHLIGNGDGDTGIWVTPEMDRIVHPMQYVQKRVYLNAGCALEPRRVDIGYVTRLAKLHEAFPRGVRLMLLAFDFNYDATGARRQDLSAFYTPNTYALALARRFPETFLPIASIHPYRPDAVAALEQAVAHGARAIKWLPSAMGMDPASPKCDAFYAALARLRIPLLTHAGEEMAVHGGEAQRLGNPLKLRRPLEQGVTVIVAHCASLGLGEDLNRGEHGPRVPNFDLFARLMDEPRYQGKLFGDISAMTQINRLGKPLETILTRPDWHDRLLNGSDYPLPAVMPLFSLTRVVERGYLDAEKVPILSAIRRHNALLFDFLLKRHVRWHGHTLASSVFETRRAFDPP